jgi:Family of unknown function (DUF6166)
VRQRAFAARLRFLQLGLPGRVYLAADGAVLFAPARAYWGAAESGGGMKTYVGDRTIDGVKVTVDGAALDPCLNVTEFSKNGFEWSYEGPEPRQLALALLVDHLGDANAARSMVEPFMKAVVANFGNEWEMTSSDLDLAVTALAGQATT